MLHVLIIQLYFHTWLLIGRDVSCHTYHRFHATLIGIQPVSSQSCCAAALETSDKPLWSGNSLLPLRALQCFTPSQHQTLSTPASKNVYLTRVIKHDHVAKSTRLSLHLSLRGQRSYVELLHGGGRTWRRG